jgi:hypothetical protein
MQYQYLNALCIFLGTLVVLSLKPVYHTVMDYRYQ